MSDRVSFSKKSIISLLLCVVFIMSMVLGTCGCEKEEEVVLLTGLHHVEIEVQDYGTICLELDADSAPITVTHFIELANSGYYNGKTFHRIISNFMIQGGSIDGAGTSGGASSIKGEFTLNGVPNYISHTRGTISMARTSIDYNSACAQFFICVEDSTNLDGSYAAFGHVTSGMDVVDSIAVNVPAEDSNGTVLAENQPIITAVRVID